jgi:GntR family transcriptional regulator/MocR family aminotransferase
MGTNLDALELAIALDRDVGRPLHIQLEAELREAIRTGRLVSGTRLPASRTLAADLGVSRRLVVEAYSQLLAEGYLRSRHGAGTFVAEGAAPGPVAAEAPLPPSLAFDFFPGSPDLAGFPRRVWLRAMREVLREAPDARFGYPDPRGALELRRAIAGHLRRVRGVVADPEAIVVCSGTAAALGLLSRVLAADGSRVIGVEDPCLPHLRAILQAHGARPQPVTVDGDGVCVDALPSNAWGVLVTPSHQAPLGVGLAPARRPALLEWAADEARVVIEDDYDAEFRYDRAPLGALQGLAPERVVYLGTASKTLAPALRLGWMLLPCRLVEPVVRARALADHGCPTLDQLALARLIDGGALDRHLRQARRRYRARRDALVRSVARHLPGARVTGVAAGLHAVVRLPSAVDGAAIVEAAAARSVGVYALGYCYAEVRRRHDGLILGYANLPEPAIDEGVRRLAEAYATVAGARVGVARSRASTKDGGAISR